MPDTGTYRGRRAASIENDRLRLTVLAEGGHVAELLDRQTGLNPLWTPPWDSIEHSAYDPVRPTPSTAGAPRGAFWRA